MEIILLQDVDNLGAKHDVVSVKSGYGRNYLIPQKLGIIANKGNTARLDDMKKQDAAREAKMLDHYAQIATSLQGVVLKVGAKAGTTGKIFGSVTSAQLTQALKEQCNVDIERRKIILPDEVKMVGSYTAELHLHPEVHTNLTFEVVQE